MHLNNFCGTAGSQYLYNNNNPERPITGKNDLSFLSIRRKELEQANAVISQEMQTLDFNSDKRRLSIKCAKQSMHCIIEDIYLGDLQAYRDWIKQAQDNSNKSYKIISVIDVNTEIELPNNVEHLKFDILDDQSAWSVENGIKNKLKVVFQFIDQARIEKKPLLIHCLAGRSRSVTILAAYLIWSCHQRHKTVLTFLQSKRWLASLGNDLKSILSEKFEKLLIHEKILN